MNLLYLKRIVKKKHFSVVEYPKESYTNPTRNNTDFDAISLFDIGNSTLDSIVDEASSVKEHITLSFEHKLMILGF